MTESVAVAMHKPYALPSDPMYLPIHVGAALHPDTLPEITQDDEGDNISSLNPYYCELTAIYWLWKNDASDYKGLVHYRRYFSSIDKRKKCAKDRLDRALTTADLNQIVNRCDAIVPKKRYYIIETVYSHYAHTHYASHLNETRAILQELSPASVV